MANQEHVNKLNEGVEAWNQWRQEHPDMKPDLDKAYLVEANLSHANLSRASLVEASLLGANLREADLTCAILDEGTDFTGATTDRCIGCPDLASHREKDLP